MKGWLFLLGALWLAGGCAANRADRLFAAGDYGAAIDAYEAYLSRHDALTPRDATALMNLALAHADDGGPWHDPARSEHYLRLLAERLPASARAREAKWLLAAGEARQRVGRLERELELRDEQLARLNAVLRLVAEAENRLRSEVEDQDEARADLESRLRALSRRSRDLAAEVAELEAELDALKRIDMESVIQGLESPP